MAASTNKRNKRKHQNINIVEEKTEELSEDEDLLQSIQKEDDSTDEEAGNDSDADDGGVDPLLYEMSGSEGDADSSEDDEDSGGEEDSDELEEEGDEDDDNEESENESESNSQSDKEEEIEWESSSGESSDDEKSTEVNKDTTEESTSKKIGRKININIKDKGKMEKIVSRQDTTEFKHVSPKVTNSKGKSPKKKLSKSINKSSTAKTTEEPQPGDKNEPTPNESGEKLEKDEYADSDTSDEEDIRNTVGNIPMNWYDEYPHVGYDWNAEAIMKPKQGDALDNFLRRMEDPNYFRTVKDPQTGQEVVLSDKDVELVKRLQIGQYPDPSYEDCPPWVEYFTSKVLDTPIRKFPEHKRSFLPSRDEALRVSKYVHAMKMGWMKTMKQEEEDRQKKKEKKFYALWGADDSSTEQMRRITSHIPAPKRYLPGHAESYNPPPEYLFDKKEMKQWEKHADEPWKRKLSYIPQKYKSLREVPAYRNYIRERFIRCLDLYLCPRAIKQKLQIQPEDLLPKLPSAKDLQPFPTVNSMVYEGHTNMVRTITVDPKGQFLISGSDDQTIRVWEVATGRCVHIVPVGGVVRSVDWCPNQALSLVAVAADRKVLLINPRVGDTLIVAKTDALLKEEPQGGGVVPERISSSIQWSKADDEEMVKGIQIVVNHFKDVRQITWHGRGDYFAAVLPEGANRSVIVHQLSRRRSQFPFSKSKGLVQCVMFHPVRPVLFVATQRNIRIYDLMKQEMIKKLVTYSQWISSMAVHPRGDNIIVGTYDRKLLWFDLDLSNEPYKALRLHTTAIRGVAFHKRYPLFASGSDDKNVIVCHGMVYNDLLENPLIVPLKRLSYHQEREDFGVFDVKFHPTQPWVFSCGADSTVRLYS